MIFVQIFVVDQSSAKAFFSVFLDILFILFLCLINLFIFYIFSTPPPTRSNCLPLIMSQIRNPPPLSVTALFSCGQPHLFLFPENNKNKLINFNNMFSI